VGYSEYVGPGREIICPSSLHGSEYRGTRGQIKSLAKSDGVHLSEVRRVHSGCRGTLKISMAMGMHFCLLSEGAEWQESKWWGNKIMGLVLKVHTEIKF